MKNTEMEKQQRYQDLTVEAGRVGAILIHGTDENMIHESHVVSIIEEGLGFNDYVFEVSKAMGMQIQSDELTMEYQADNFLVVVGNTRTDVDGEIKTFMSLAPKYKDDADFIYLSSGAIGEVVIDNARDVAGWRDLEDKDDDDLDMSIYDYFMNPNGNGIIRYKKPIIAGDYSDQVPNVVKIRKEMI